MRQSLHEVNKNVRTAPLARMHAAEKIDCRPTAVAAFADLKRMTGALLPGFVWQRNKRRKRVVRRGRD